MQPFSGWLALWWAFVAVEGAVAVPKGNAATRAIVTRGSLGSGSFWAGDTLVPSSDESYV